MGMFKDLFGKIKGKEAKEAKEGKEGKQAAKDSNAAGAASAVPPSTAPTTTSTSRHSSSAGSAAAPATTNTAGLPLTRNSRGSNGNGSATAGVPLSRMSGGAVSTASAPTSQPPLARNSGGSGAATTTSAALPVTLARRSGPAPGAGSTFPSSSVLPPPQPFDGVPGHPGSATAPTPLGPFGVPGVHSAAGTPSFGMPMASAPSNASSVLPPPNHSHSHPHTPTHGGGGGGSGLMSSHAFDTGMYNAVPSGQYPSIYPAAASASSGYPTIYPSIDTSGPLHSQDFAAGPSMLYPSGAFFSQEDLRSTYGGAEGSTHGSNSLYGSGPYYSGALYPGAGGMQSHMSQAPGAAGSDAGVGGVGGMGPHTSLVSSAGALSAAGSVMLPHAPATSHANGGGGSSNTSSIAPAGPPPLMSIQAARPSPLRPIAPHHHAPHSGGSSLGGPLTALPSVAASLGGGASFISGTSAAASAGHASNGVSLTTASASIVSGGAGALDRAPEPAAVIRRLDNPAQVQSSQSSAAAGTSGMSASPIACLTTAITMADQMQTMLEKVVTNRMRCQRIVARATTELPHLRSLLHSIQSEPGAEGGRRFQAQLVAVRDVYSRAHACVRKWSQSHNSKLKVLTNMLCSKQHEQEFVDINLSLATVLNDLNLALQPLYDAQSIQCADSMGPSAGAAGRPTPAPSSATSVDGIPMTQDGFGDGATSSGPKPTSSLPGVPHSGFSSNSITASPTPSDMVSLYDDDARSDLRSFAGLIVSQGGWAGLGPEERNAISALYRAKGLDLVTLLSQAQTAARANVVCNKLSDLEYINWDDINGPRGLGSPLECICVGGKATLYHGKWQGTEVAVKKIEGADHRKAQEELARETYIMSTCTHPNIARIFGLTREPSTGIPSIIMKFYKRGSLLDVMCGASTPNSAPSTPGGGRSLSGASVGAGLMSTGGSGVQGSAGALALSIVARIRLARGIARGMAYLHERPNEAITHGNLNPRNVLVDERSNPPVLHPVIADFGLSSMKTQTRTIVPTLGARSVVYTAPEVMERLLNPIGAGGHKPAPEGDVYAYSMILYELFSGVQPFEGRTEAQVLQLVAAGHRPPLTRPLAGEGPSISLTSSAGSILNNSNMDLTSLTGGAGAPSLASGGSFGAAVEPLVPPPLANIIECCWDQDPARRPAFSQVITGLEAAAVALQLKLD